MPKGKTQRNLDLIAACYDILQDIHPATVRAVCYQLFIRGIDLSRDTLLPQLLAEMA